MVAKDSRVLLLQVQLLLFLLSPAETSMADGLEICWHNLRGSTGRSCGTAPSPPPLPFPLLSIAMHCETNCGLKTADHSTRAVGGLSLFLFFRSFFDHR